MVDWPLSIGGQMSDIEDLKAQAQELIATLNEAKEALAPINDAEVQLNAEKHMLDEQYKASLAQLNERKQAIAKKKWDAQQAASNVNSQISQIQQKIVTLQQEEAKKQAELEAETKKKQAEEALSAEFEKATFTAPWREWAKQHQLDAGHKITRDRYVVLADPMGLGKTLSSIVTADMTQRITKEASEALPWMGIEEQVYVPPKEIWTQLAEESYDSDTTLSYITDNVIAGERIPYLNFEQRREFKERGYFERIEGYYKTEIVNAVQRPVGRKILYFCPSALLRNVLEEWRRWSPHRSVTFIGSMSKAEREYALNTITQNLAEFVIIVNYEAWRRDKALLERLTECDFDTVIIDEAHNIKDMKSTAYKGVQQIIYQTRPEYVIPMTGTPILNRPQELYSILSLLTLKEFPPNDAGLNTYLARYCESYYVPDSTTPRWRFKPGGLDLLAKKISTNFMRRTKEQAGIILPDKSVIYHDLTRDDEAYPLQAKARHDMKKFATLVIGEASNSKALQATAIIAMITRLRQIETWPACIIQYVTKEDPETKKKVVVRDPFTGEKLIRFQLDVEESQKLDYVIRYDKETEEWEGLIPDTVEDERMVVFSQFKAPLVELKRRIEASGRTAVILDGSTPNAVREEIRLDFDRRHTPDRSKAKWDVLLANYKAGGVGLNLTCATSMIVCDSEWNPGKREQAFDRIHRIGQTEKVTINVLNVKSTIDDWLEAIMKEKEKIVDGFEGTMTNISAQDLMDAIESGLI
jgi:superfamily II DNA or RNA helicase